MEVSKRSFIRKKLNSLYNLNIGRDEFYKMVCGYNDNILKLANFGAVIDYLYEIDDANFYQFYGYVYDMKYLVPSE